jgi:hypothetical protein
MSRRHGRSLSHNLAGNGHGDFRENRINTMSYYDRLPFSLRRAIANAAGDYATGPIYRDWQNGADPSDIIKKLK